MFGGGPPPTIEMIKVVHKSKLVLSMAAGSGQLKFVTDNNKLNIEGSQTNLELSMNCLLCISIPISCLILIELFFRVVKEGIGVETKNLFVNAILSHVISIQHPSVGTEVRLSESMAERKQ